MYSEWGSDWFYLFGYHQHFLSNVPLSFLHLHIGPTLGLPLVLCPKLETFWHFVTRPHMDHAVVYPLCPINKVSYHSTRAKPLVKGLHYSFHSHSSWVSAHYVDL